MSVSLMSTLTRTRPRARSSTSASVGIACPSPASRARAATADISRRAPDPEVVRLTSASWRISSAPSEVRRTSHSTTSAPWAIASSKAAGVFSGRSADAPRWATFHNLRDVPIARSYARVRNGAYDTGGPPPRPGKLPA